MGSEFLNFMSYNSTGLDLVKTKWIRDIIKTFNIDFFQLQEHFKTIKTLDSYFRKEFPSNDSFVVPGHRDPFQESGRAKGGLAQLANKALEINKTRILTKNWRLQAQILQIKQYKIIWINCYFPPDPQTLQYDDEDLEGVLNEIENILDSNTFDDCIVGGDINFDSTRSTGFANTVRNFFSRLGLVSAWQKFPIDFTHIHTEMKSLATLDHFFVNQRLLDCIVDAGPVHLGDNLSRHSPIMIKIKLSQGVTLRSLEQDIPRPRKPAWYKATLEDKDKYTELLDLKLRDLEIPESLDCMDILCKCPEHSQDRDSHVIDILCTIVETSYSCIPLTAKPRSSKTEGHCLPNWNTIVAPKKADSLFWHSVWKDAGSPQSGGLHQVMCQARRDYHTAVKKAKRTAANAKAEELLAASEAGDAALIYELKKSLDKKYISQRIPESLDGQTTPDSILERFRLCYQELFNSAADNLAMAEIKATVEQLIDDKSAREVSKVTPEIVKQACSMMKSGKNDVTDAYSSDALLNAPDYLFHLLASVFRSYLTHGTLTLQILSCAFLPLFKGGLKSPDKFDSYRAIAGASQLLKLFEYVVLILWGDLMSTDSMQFGFKSGVSTTQCSWLVHEVATYFMRRGTAEAACLLECSKAFDKCKFHFLFSKLIKKGIPAVVVRALIFIYEEQTCWVKLGNKKSTIFSVSNGTRQGSVLSPLLFSVYLDDLLQKLRYSQLGCHIGGYWYGGCGYADDIILMAPNREVLQRMVDVCQSYAVEHNLVFSTDPVPALSKTKCILFCGRQGRVRYPDPVQLDGKDLPWVESAVHLGHTLHQLVSMEKDCTRARAKYIERTVQLRQGLSFANPDQVLKAAQIYCTDGYGSMIWNLESAASEQLFKSWNTMVKLIYEVPRSTYTYLVEGHLAAGHTSLRNQILSRYPGFFRKLLDSPSKEVRVLARMVSGDPRSSTCSNLRYLEKLTGLSKPQFCSAAKVRAALPVKEVPVQEVWRLGLLDYLLLLRKDKYLEVQDSKRICAMIDSLCST